MSADTSRVDEFVGEVRRRLNRELWWRTLCWSLLAGGVAMLGVAAVYLAQGYQAPVVGYPVVLLASLAGAAATWWWLRWDDEATELFIDRFFGLKDSVSSMRGFERSGKTGGFYELQRTQVERALASLEPDRIERQPAGALTGGALAVIGLAAALGFIGPSEQVQAMQEEARATRAQTAQLNQELEKFVQEMLEEGDEELAELVDPNDLRKWVDELEATEDRREALRQYAAFEREINRMTANLSQERDEELLAEVGEKLKEQAEGRELGEKLERKQFADAAEDLEKLTPEDIENLEDAARERDRNAQLKKLAEQMASASREAQQRRGAGNRRSEANASKSDDSAGSASTSSSLANSSGAAGQAGKAGEDGDVSEMDEQLAKMLDELAKSVEDYDEALGECENPGDGEGDKLALAQQRGKSAGEQLRRIRQRLNALEARRRAQQKLAGLCQALGECQGQLAGMPSSSPGGKGAGVGTADSFDNQSETPSEGQLTQLRGQKGEGPSLTSVEDADSGTGVSARGSAEMEYEFERQVESFVQREDVPRGVRDGVKHYFENIHEGADDAPAE